MSIAAVAWALRVPVQGPLKGVLVALADHADDQGGSCYPSIERLVLFSGFKERAVQYALRDLVASGWITAGSLKGGRGNATRYALNLRLAAVADDQPSFSNGASGACGIDGGKDAGGACNGAPRATKDAGGAEKGAPRAPEPSLTVINHQEPSVLSASAQVDLLGELPAAMKKDPAKLNGHTADFDRWYAAYPKKEDRGHAVAAYAKAIKAGATPAEILAGLQRNVSALREKERKYIPLPATWLNGQRWTDEPAPVEREREAQLRGGLG